MTYGGPQGYPGQQPGQWQQGPGQAQWQGQQSGPQGGPGVAPLKRPSKALLYVGALLILFSTVPMYMWMRWEYFPAGIPLPFFGAGVEIWIPQTLAVVVLLFYVATVFLLVLGLRIGQIFVYASTVFSVFSAILWVARFREYVRLDKNYYYALIAYPAMIALAALLASLPVSVRAIRWGQMRRNMRKQEQRQQMQAMQQQYAQQQGYSPQGWQQGPRQ